MAPLDEKNSKSVEDTLAAEAEELDGYFSDAPLQPKPNYPDLNDSLDTVIVVTNLPKVPEKKVEKLTKVVYKLVSRIGSIVDHTAGESAGGGIFMPYDKEKDTTMGFCFVEYETPAMSKNAVEVLQGYKFDKNHSLNVSLYPRSKQLQKVDTKEFAVPESSKQQHIEAQFEGRPNAMSWLEDGSQRDSFVVRFGSETVVNWFDARNDPVEDYNGYREKEAGVVWCEYYCHWSPNGSYLATLVPGRGVILWCGSKYEKFGRFPAPGVKIVLFSPQENYLLTNNEDPRDPAAIKVYHVPTGKLLRAFPLFPDGYVRAKAGKGGGNKDGGDGEGGGGGGSANVPPPPFAWSCDDKYLARMGDGLISIYETPSMKLLDKRSLAAPGIHEFQWSPKANIIAYWAPEANNSPAHVDLIEIPSRRKIRQKNLFNVTKCNMVWHDQGDYLAVKVTRHTKSKKTLYNNIELFRLNETGVPVEMLDIKDAVMALSWEPRGSRFAMIHAENPTAAKVSVSFHDMKKRDGNTLTSELNHVDTLPGRQCNCIFWSPAGTTILMASLGDTASGTLEFYDVDTKTMVVKEHYRANQVFWDPSGRTVATVVSQPIEGGHFKFAMDNGYVLWSFQGKQLYQQSFETFYQFLWRPRQSLLSKEEIAKVKKNLKKYEKQFDKADRERQRLLYLEETKGKRAERSKIRELLARNRAIRAKQRPQLIELLGGFDSDDDRNYVIRDKTIEAVISTKEEVVM